MNLKTCTAAFLIIFLSGTALADSHTSESYAFLSDVAVKTTVVEKRKRP